MVKESPYLTRALIGLGVARSMTVCGGRNVIHMTPTSPVFSPEELAQIRVRKARTSSNPWKNLFTRRIR